MTDRILKDWNSYKKWAKMLLGIHRNTGYILTYMVIEHNMYFLIYLIGVELPYHVVLVSVFVLVIQFCWLFENPWTVVLPGSSVHGILQARILEWVAIWCNAKWMSYVYSYILFLLSLLPPHQNMDFYCHISVQLHDFICLCLLSSNSVREPRWGVETLGSYSPLWLELK